LVKNSLKAFLRLFWNVLTHKKRKKFFTKNSLKAFFVAVFDRFSPIKKCKKIWPNVRSIFMPALGCFWGILPPPARRGVVGGCWGVFGLFWGIFNPL
jgi:hypothetical protein